LFCGVKNVKCFRLRAIFFIRSTAKY
jgi:hypothetical protein